MDRPEYSCIFYFCVLAELQSQLLDICCRPVAAGSHPSSLDVFLLMASKSSEDDKEASSKAKCKVAGGKELMLLSLPLDADGLQGEGPILECF